MALFKMPLSWLHFMPMVPILLSVIFVSYQNSKIDSASPIEFLLWTNSNRYDEFKIMPGSLHNLSSSSFVKSGDLKVLVHGYRDSPTTKWITDTRDAYLRLGVSNVISVNWEAIASSYNYYNVAIHQVPYVGINLGLLVEYLVNYHFCELSQVHFVCHSIGSHICGVAGSKLLSNVSRITSLDAAGLLFFNFGKTRRLDKSDAVFVDAIHTTYGVLGYFDPIGHVDFYPNGGFSQPGCEMESFIFECSHQMAHALFLQSLLLPNGFRAYKCDSWKSFQNGSCDLCSTNSFQMGLQVQKPYYGKYYFETLSHSRINSVDCYW